LPTEEWPGDRSQGLASQIDAGRRRQRGDVMLYAVEVGRLSLEPGALADRLGNDEGHGGALEILAVMLHEHAARLAQPRGDDTTGLVKLERLEQTHHERRTEMRLILDEGIGEGEFLCGGLGNPGGQFL